MPSYGELLRDPRWQKMRLEVMEREGFECQECGAKHKTLNVHHAYYENGRKPWEYPSETLRCLCEDCHKRVEEDLREIRRLVGLSSKAPRENILGYVRAAACTSLAVRDVVPVPSLYVASGIAHFFRMASREVWALRAPDGNVNLLQVWSAMMDKDAAACGPISTTESAG